MLMLFCVRYGKNVMPYFRLFLSRLVYIKNNYNRPCIIHKICILHNALKKTLSSIRSESTQLVFFRPGPWDRLPCMF